MAGTWQIDVEPRLRLLRIHVQGFLAAEDVEALAQGRSEALGRLRCDRNAHVVLVDVRNCEIQAQDVASRFACMIDFHENAARKVAFVTGARSLAKLQARRLTAALGAIRLFDDVDSAQIWLFDGA